MIEKWKIKLGVLPWLTKSETKWLKRRCRLICSTGISCDRKTWRTFAYLRVFARMIFVSTSMPSKNFGLTTSWKASKVSSFIFPTRRKLIFFSFVQRWLRLIHIVLLECAHNLIYARCFLSYCSIVCACFFFLFLSSPHNAQTSDDRRHDVCYWSNIYCVIYIMKIRFATKSFSIKAAAAVAVIANSSTFMRAELPPSSNFGYMMLPCANDMNVTTYFVQVFFRVRSLIHSPNLFCRCSTT